MDQGDRMDTEADHSEPSQTTNDTSDAMDCEDTSSSKQPSSKTKAQKLRDELKKDFPKLFKQLSEGCGRYKCPTKYCASNPEHGPISRKEAAAKTVKLLKLKKKEPIKLCEIVEPMTINNIRKLVKDAEASGNVSKVTKYVFKSFSNPDIIDQSFKFEAHQDDEKHTQKPGIGTEEDSQIDMKAIDEAYELLLENENFSDAASDNIAGALNNALSALVTNHFQYNNRVATDPHQLRKYAILLLCPLFCDFTYYDAFRKICKSIQVLSDNHRKILAQWLTKFDTERFDALLCTLQQFITIKWMDTEKSGGLLEQYEAVAPIVVVIDIIHQANKKTKYLKFPSFYNDAINEKYKYTVREDFIYWKRKMFSFCKYDFLLDAAAKSQLLQIDASTQMNQEARSAMLNIFISGNRANSPYLIMKINRNRLIEDALMQLQRKDSMDYKKPLKVKFIGEEGVDEGGVQKEFFQLIIRQLFQPNYGMFEYLEETRLYWFNKDAYETPLEFELIGIILGLAVYNGVILDIHFPAVVYRKLMVKNYIATLEDLKEFKPDVVTNLKKLLEFEGDVESTFCLTFSFEYNLYGEKKVVELKENGANITLTGENRQEYVDLYVNYIINDSVQKQFGAFYDGFHLVCGGEFFAKFNWEELVLLICGSEELNFDLLQESARYEDGFEESSQTMLYFWEVIHELDEENKKKFLFFCTGSDRVPIRGLGDLVLTISKNGTEVDRLPTAHTCFNHLLLPEYPTKSILKERLLKAIQNSEGFGLL